MHTTDAVPATLTIGCSSQGTTSKLFSRSKIKNKIIVSFGHTADIKMDHGNMVH